MENYKNIVLEPTTKGLRRITGGASSAAAVIMLAYRNLKPGDSLIIEDDFKKTNWVFEKKRRAS